MMTIGRNSRAISPDEETGFWRGRANFLTPFTARISPRFDLIDRYLPSFVSPAVSRFEDCRGKRKCPSALEDCNLNSAKPKPR